MTERRSLPPPRYGPRKREYALAALALALALFAWHGGDKPEDRVMESLPLPASFRCMPTQDGFRLRLAVRHCPDGVPSARWCYSECGYGSIERRDWQ